MHGNAPDKSKNIFARGRVKYCAARVSFIIVMSAFIVCNNIWNSDCMYGVYNCALLRIWNIQDTELN